MPPPSRWRHHHQHERETNVNHDDIKALYEVADKAVPFSGSDEWDLNDAWRSGFECALDIILQRTTADIVFGSEE
jgi:hypothetical protein